MRIAWSEFLALDLFAIWTAFKDILASGRRCIWAAQHLGWGFLVCSMRISREHHWHLCISITGIGEQTWTRAVRLRYSSVVQFTYDC